MKATAAFGLVALTGCYSLLTVNLGVVNKVAASNGAIIDPEVACAALAPFRFKVDSKNVVQPDVEGGWTRNCQRILGEQAQAKGAKP